MVGRRAAIESEVPGTTRDRLYASLNLEGLSTLLVDTGGIELGKEENSLEANVQKQSQVAIEGADLILFVVDVRTELTSEDYHAADLLRKSKKPVILVANKCDNDRLEQGCFNLYELGFGEPLAVSALHSDGVDALMGQCSSHLLKLGFAPREQLEEKERRIKIAFLGRPNVGKSTMVNALFGKERVVTSERAGTTRDATEIPFEFDGVPFTLIDTAGLRRRGKIESGIEKFSVLRTMQAIYEADVCILILDFEEGIASQDCHVSQFILEEEKGLVLVVNKVDLEKGAEREAKENLYIHRLKRKMAYLPWAPVIFTSALERKNVFKVLELAVNAYEQRQKTITQDELDVWLYNTLRKHPPKGQKGKRRFEILRVKQGVHYEGKAPSFVFECKWPEYMHFSYERFLENELRAKFGFVGTALKLIFRKPGRDS